MTHLTKFLFIALVFALGACFSPTSLDHQRSQSRLDEGLQRLQAARAEAVKAAASPTPSLGASGTATQSVNSVQSARLALARDAERDLDTATGSLAARDPSDRISLLFRATNKAWNAGRATPTNVAQRISKAGSSACKDDNVRLAPRDCQIINIAPQLTAMQAAADVIFDTQIELTVAEKSGNARLSVAEMNDLIKAIQSLNARSNELDGEKRQSTLTGVAMRPDLQSFVEQFQLQSWCHAVVAIDLLVKARDAAGAKIGLEATNRLLGVSADVSPALQAALAQGGLSASGITGTYERYSSKMLALANVSASRSDSQDISGHIGLCDS